MKIEEYYSEHVIIQTENWEQELAKRNNLWSPNSQIHQDFLLSSSSKASYLHKPHI